MKHFGPSPFRLITDNGRVAEKKKKKKEKGNGVLVSRSWKEGTNEKYTNSFTLLPLRSQSLRFCTVVDHRRLKGIFPFEPYTHTRKREREGGEGGLVYSRIEKRWAFCARTGIRLGLSDSH